MIQKIGAGAISFNRYNNVNNSLPAAKNNAATLPAFSQNYTATSLVNAYQAYHGINTAKTVSFGSSLSETLGNLRTTMVTCRDTSEHLDGEEVGKSVNISELINNHHKDIPTYDDAIKTTVEVFKEEDKPKFWEHRDKKPDKLTEGRVQLKRTNDGIMYEMAVRQTRDVTSPYNRDLPLKQNVQIIQHHNLPETAYVLTTKSDAMAVIEDGDDVILTNEATVTKKANDPKMGLKIHATQYISPKEKAEDDAKKPEERKIREYGTKENQGIRFKKFDVPTDLAVKERKHLPSIGEGTEIVIGMENGRFVPEIIKSIEDFQYRIDHDEIILDQFVANKDAKNTQLSMLAGGFGSRAEYTNASSSAIFHNEEDGATSTKGVFKTATGLTPMETTFITLHNAGLLDCSKGKFGIGKNVQLYLNKSGVNKGNGGFTLDLYHKMEREGRESLTIFPNDSMSRMTEATRKLTNIMNTGDVAIAMIAKEVEVDNARGKLGIMSIDDNNQITDFAEKPKEVDPKFIRNGKCLTNTFQFAVSKDAFRALSFIEPLIPDGDKESRDWSKAFVPILMNLSQVDDLETCRDNIVEKLHFEDKEQLPLETVRLAKEALHGQKIVAVPTSEPWADCGTLSALYHTTMQIASNDFPLEDFERKHVIDCINPKTGLVASSKEQKERIEAKYDIDGQVMVVPQAEKVDKQVLQNYINVGMVSINR